MPLHRATVEAQLKRAEDALNARAQTLTAGGCQTEKHGNDPWFRTLRADCHQIRRRLASIAKTEAVNADVAARAAGNAEGSDE